MNARPNNTARSLDAVVNTGHDGVSAVLVRVAYGIDYTAGADCMVSGLQGIP